MDEIKQHELLKEMIKLQRNQCRISNIILILLSPIAAFFLLLLIYAIYVVSNIIFKMPIID